MHYIPRSVAEAFRAFEFRNPQEIAEKTPPDRRWPPTPSKSLDAPRFGTRLQSERGPKARSKPKSAHFLPDSYTGAHRLVSAASSKRRRIPCDLVKRIIVRRRQDSAPPLCPGKHVQMYESGKKCAYQGLGNACPTKMQERLEPIRPNPYAQAALSMQSDAESSVFRAKPSQIAK